MLDFLNLFNFVAAIITIIATTISIILWIKYRERDKWIYNNFLSILEGLNRIVVFSGHESDDERLSRVCDMSRTLRGTIVASMKTIYPKRSDRLKSWEFGYKDRKEKMGELAVMIGEMSNPEKFYSEFLDDSKDCMVVIPEDIELKKGNSKHSKRR